MNKDRRKRLEAIAEQISSLIDEAQSICDEELMLVRTDYLGIDGHMIRHQRIGNFAVAFVMASLAARTVSSRR